jgi:hypothetical protein
VRREVIRLPYKESDTGSSPVPGTKFVCRQFETGRSYQYYATVAERPNARDCKSLKPLVQIQPVAPCYSYKYLKMNSHNTLVTCGCSFTQQSGWANHVRDYFAYQKLLNLAIGGGTNHTQINRINDFLLSTNQPFDLIWQITFPTRTGNMRLPPDHPDVVGKKYMPTHNNGFMYAQRSPIKNYIDSKFHIDILYDDYVLKRQDFFYADINNDISQLLCTMLLVNQLADHMLVFFGIDDIDQIIVDQMETFFTNRQIAFVPYTQNLLGYVKSNQFALADDKWHPANESYVIWADHILIPAISQNWKIQ